MDVAYLYLLREDYLEDICKIGKTKQKCCTKINRFNAYDKETEIIALREVPIESLDELEKFLIKDFKTKYKVAKGNEYFHCTRNQALETFDSFVDTHIKNKVLLDIYDYTLTEEFKKKDKKEQDKNKTFKCEKCNHQFIKKSHLNSHLKKKYPCDKLEVNSIKCVHCEKIIHDGTNINRHLKTCKVFNQNKSNKV